MKRRTFLPLFLMTLSVNPQEFRVPEAVGFENLKKAVVTTAEIA